MLPVDRFEGGFGQGFGLAGLKPQVTSGDAVSGCLAHYFCAAPVGATGAQSDDASLFRVTRAAATTLTPVRAEPTAVDPPFPAHEGPDAWNLSRGRPSAGALLEEALPGSTVARPSEGRQPSTRQKEQSQIHNH